MQKKKKKHDSHNNRADTILYDLSLFVFPDKNKCVSYHFAIQKMFLLISNKNKHVILQPTISKHKFLLCMYQQTLLLIIWHFLFSPCWFNLFFCIPFCMVFLPRSLAWGHKRPQFLIFCFCNFLDDEIKC